MTARPDDEALRAPKMADYVARELRRQIVNGEFVEGSTLPTEGQLVERFGVSRTPIREAMRVLEVEGLIASRQGARNGAYVRSPSTAIAARHTGMVLRRKGATLADVYQARIAIEPFAARLLAQVATPEVVAALKALHRAECERVGDPPAWGRAAAAFHRAIVENCGNPAIAVLTAQLDDIVSGQIAVEMAEAGEGEAVDRERADAAHGRLIGLIERGEADKAEAFWRSHLEAAWPSHTVTETLSVEELLSDRRPGPGGPGDEVRARALVRRSGEAED